MSDQQNADAAAAPEIAAADDPYLWLEEVDTERVRAWVEARNSETTSALCDAQFERDKTAVLGILNAADRIPWVSQRGVFVYNFWQDAEHRKGSGGGRPLTAIAPTIRTGKLCSTSTCWRKVKAKIGFGMAARRCRLNIAMASSSPRAVAPMPP
jgi:hypothetical protein